MGELRKEIIMNDQMTITVSKEQAEKIKEDARQVKLQECKEMAKELKVLKDEVIKNMCKWVNFCYQLNVASTATIEATKIIISEYNFYEGC